MVVCITDGQLMINNDGIETEVDKWCYMCGIQNFIIQLILQDGHPTEGSELTREVYRWDQRLFSVVLRLPGIGGSSTNSKDPLPSEVALTKLAEATGGESQSYSIDYQYGHLKTDCVKLML